MQSIARSIYSQAALMGTSRRVLPLVAAKTQLPFRSFAAEIELKKKEESAVDIDQRNKRLGVDTVFSEQKHAYVLTFPWNF